MSKTKESAGALPAHSRPLDVSWMANCSLGYVSHGGSTPFSRQFSVSENSNSRANAVRGQRVGSVATDDERSLILQMLKGERRERGGRRRRGR